MEQELKYLSAYIKGVEEDHRDPGVTKEKLLALDYIDRSFMALLLTQADAYTKSVEEMRKIKKSMLHILAEYAAEYSARQLNDDEIDEVVNKFVGNMEKHVALVRKNVEATCQCYVDWTVDVLNEINHRSKKDA